MKHWLSYDVSYIDLVERKLKEGSNFAIKTIHPHPTKVWIYILEIESPDKYQELDIDCNSMGSPLKHHHHKPAGLRLGMPLAQYQETFGRFV